MASPHRFTPRHHLARGIAATQVIAATNGIATDKGIAETHGIIAPPLPPRCFAPRSAGPRLAHRSATLRRSPNRATRSLGCGDPAGCGDPTMRRPSRCRTDLPPSVNATDADKASAPQPPQRHGSAIHRTVGAQYAHRRAERPTPSTRSAPLAPLLARRAAVVLQGPERRRRQRRLRRHEPRGLRRQAVDVVALDEGFLVGDGGGLRGRGPPAPALLFFQRGAGAPCLGAHSSNAIASDRLHAPVALCRGGHRHGSANPVGWLRRTLGRLR